MVAALKIPVLFHPPKVADFHMIAFAYPQITFMMAHLGASPPRTGPSTWRRSTLQSGLPTCTGNLQRDPLEASGDGVQGDTREADLRERWTGRDSRVEIHKIRP